MSHQQETSYLIDREILVSAENFTLRHGKYLQNYISTHVRSTKRTILNGDLSPHSEIKCLKNSKVGIDG